MTRSSSPRTLIVFGVGKLGGPVVDLLAARYPTHRYVLVARTRERAHLRANLTRYVCSQWGRYPSVEGAATDLRDPARTAELIDEHQPDVIFNATTPFPWWAIEAMPAAQRRLTYSAGLGMWCALDCVLPLGLDHALSLCRSRPRYVNGCYPDMVNPFLAGSPVGPIVGVGNMSNLIPGLRLALAPALGAAPRDVRISLVAHHYTSLNAPSLGGAGGAPYHLVVSAGERELVYSGSDDTPFAALKATASRVRGLDGQGVTISSAATVVASLLNGERRRHHAPGPLGLPGGYPLVVEAQGEIVLDLPDGMSRDDAVAINASAQRFDGIAAVSSGRVVLTDECRMALRAITDIDVAGVTPDNAVEISVDVIAQLNRRYGLQLSL
jgi:hypothetical protein